MNYIDIFLVGFSIIILIMVVYIIYFRLKNLKIKENDNDNKIEIQDKKVLVLDGKKMKLVYDFYENK